MTDQEKFMREAIRQAKKAYLLEEVPIGCVIVHDGKIIARGYNQRNTRKTSLGHAELLAIRKANKKLGDWRLEDCTMYITLEPCPMCAGTAIMAGVDEIIYGADDPRCGCAGSVYALPEDSAFGRGIPCVGGVLKEECRAVLDAFFLSKRK